MAAVEPIGPRGGKAVAAAGGTGAGSGTRAGRAPARLTVLVVVLLTLLGCTTGGSEEDSTPSGGVTATGSEPGPEGEHAGLSIAVVGDSITVGSTYTFAPGEVSEDSWVSYAVGDSIELAGGWARWGATTAEMAAEVSPVPADVLVIMAGTNDLAVGTAPEDVAANLEQIAAEVGADQVLLCGVPPLDARPEVVPPFNEFLHETADAHGWAWVDPADGIRSEGAFTPGMSADGVHPTRAGATEIGARVREALLEFAQ